MNADYMVMGALPLAEFDGYSLSKDSFSSVERQNGSITIPGKNLHDSS